MFIPPRNSENTLRWWTMRQLREHVARRLKLKAQVSDPRVKLYIGYDPTILHERIRGQNWFQLCLAYMLVSPTTLIYCIHSTAWTLMFKGFAWFSTERVLQECTGSYRLANGFLKFHISWISENKTNLKAHAQSHVSDTVVLISNNKSQQWLVLDDHSLKWHHYSIH